MNCTHGQSTRETWRPLPVALWLVLLLALWSSSGWAAHPPAARMIPKTEDEFIQALSSKDAGTVVLALSKLEDRYPSSTKAFPKMKELLTDSRVRVRRKAARVLGVLHADVDEKNNKAICAMLKSEDIGEVIDGLKSLRGVKGPNAVPEITPLLQHSHPNVMRDACRTLAVLGTKEVIPAMEPLLKHKNPDVQKDAQAAIAALRAKA